jgi:hypothetical protein
MAKIYHVRLKGKEQPVPVKAETAETTAGIVIFKDKDGKETGRFKTLEVQGWSIEGQ